ncbi:hypothetical protein M409DRAFT_23960 [Zasmidium cellare ATCC 36951]|uniref:Fungal N-terminal domain-containing protein n=1 Tax=Zasmidium cellare ATCC 36951 TaxID=1080233 RepID=A0A6A6CHL8_ZASCE|nr:uncharacterized protein M409DRAFT_23960 [Zasmidium cellare ATCC 36951]KAF2165670.1 hypothetical protein M409DRAFT_23960 [Zasmidium cellare ATCC 36951]
MAEAVIGVVSAGAGLLSLAIQLGESIQKLKSFHARVKNAPTMLADLILELESMGLSLDIVERYKSQDTIEAGLVAHCLARCRTTTERIQNIVDRIHDIGTKRARLAKFYVAVKDPEIMRLLQELGQARGSLAMSLLMFYSERQHQCSEVQNEILQRLVTQLNNFLAQPQASGVPPATVSHLSSFCSRGRDLKEAQSDTNFASRQESCSSDPDQTRNRHHTKGKRASEEILATIRLPKLLFSQAWSVSVVRTSIGFAVNLCPYMGRDPWSEIFLRCATGNTRAVQRLIGEGQASLRDVSEGSVFLQPRTIMHNASFDLLQQFSMAMSIYFSGCGKNTEAKGSTQMLWYTH